MRLALARPVDGGETIDGRTGQEQHEEERNDFLAVIEEVSFHDDLFV